MNPLRPALGGLLAWCLAPVCGAGDRPAVTVEIRFERAPAASVPTENFTPAQIAAALLRETNRVRAAHDLRPFKPQPALEAAADDHAAFMAMTFRAHHECPIPGQRDAVERVGRHGLQPELVAENVLGTGFTAPRDPAPTCDEFAAEIIAQWMNSPGHRANILNPALTHCGCSARRTTFIGGTVGYYSAQVFAKP